MVFYFVTQSEQSRFSVAKAQPGLARTLLASVLGQIPALLRADPASLATGIKAHDWKRTCAWAAIILAGTGSYGLAMGWWRSPLQGLYVSIKFPLAILLTTAGNALLNGMLAPLLGIDLRWRQTMLLVMMSFTIASLILGALSPLAAFLVWSAPPLEAGKPIPAGVYSLILLVNVVAIAFAGAVSNVKLLGLLRHLGGNRTASLKVLAAWLAGNLFLGSQIVWILRPLIGSPNLTVQFLRADAFHGSFFEAVLFAIRQLFFSN
jgi:hypothetical protein